MKDVELSMKDLKYIVTDKPFWMFTDNADEDYIVARLLTFCGYTLWHSAAYHSHQAIEKYLKAFMVQEAGKYPEIHNLKKLGEVCSAQNEIFKKSEYKKLLEKFDEFEQVSRYGGFAKFDPLSTKNDNFITSGAFTWTDKNIKELDKIVFDVRLLLKFPDNMPGVNILKAILEENKQIQFVNDWKLPISLKEILITANDYFK